LKNLRNASLTHEDEV